MSITQTTEETFYYVEYFSNLNNDWLLAPNIHISGDYKEIEEVFNDYCSDFPMIKFRLVKEKRIIEKEIMSEKKLSDS